MLRIWLLLVLAVSGLENELNSTLVGQSSTSPSHTTSQSIFTTHDANESFANTEASHSSIPLPNDDISEGAIEEAISGNFSEDCHFLSFEEWKKQKELEAQARSSESNLETSTSVGNALETIKLDSTPLQSIEPDIVEDQGKTYKDKFNYASGDCAATVVKTNSDAKGASAILSEVKDSYLLNRCSTPNKFVVIELCQDILVSSIAMANFELFSSMFRKVRFSVSDSFPATSWQVLGETEAQNIRDTQVFDIENPLIWARYLKIEILSHYGDEFYCPISVVRVHGTTMMEEVKKDSPKVVEQVSKPEASSQSVLFEYTDDEDECKALSPYLTLNEFLKDINNSTAEYCELPVNASSTPIESTSTVKTTQESIFKNIVKRLSLLETNATLSLLYVEEQSKLLSDAFAGLEKRHSSKLNNLILKFNKTVNAQVNNLQAAYEISHQQSNGLLKKQEQALRDILGDLTRRNSALASDLSFQRKIIIVDTLLILVLLMYVIIGREFDIEEEQYRAGRPKRKKKRIFSATSKRALGRAK